MIIPFNKPYMTGKELGTSARPMQTATWPVTVNLPGAAMPGWRMRIGCNKALLTHSCTAALEMTAILADLQPGDEVIMPSYTFVSTANAFVLRGAVPVFVDIRPDTLNIDETG